MMCMTRLALFKYLFFASKFFAKYLLLYFARSYYDDASADEIYFRVGSIDFHHSWKLRIATW